MKIKANITLKENDGRMGPIFSGYRPTFRIKSTDSNSDCVLFLINDKENIKPGESDIVVIKILHPEKLKINEGDSFILTEGLKEVINGTILSTNV